MHRIAPTAVEAGHATRAALQAHEAYVAEQVLAERVAFEAAPEGAFAAEGKVGSGGAPVRFALRKR